MSDRRPRAALALAVALSLWPAATRAQSPSVRSLVEQGFAARRAQHDEEALARFREALALEPSAMVRAQVALAELALGRWRDADAHLQEALAATSDPWIVRNTDALRAAAARLDEHLGTLDLYGGVEGAEASVDGEAVGRLPLPRPLRWPVGRVTVRVRAGGYDPVERTTVVHPGEVTRESVAQRVAEAVVPAPTTPPVPQVVVAPPTIVAVPVVVTREVPARPARTLLQRVGGAPWAVVGAGAMVAAVLTPLLVSRRDAAGEELRAMGCSLDAQGTAFRCAGDGAAATAAHDRGATYAALANAAWATGTAVAVAGVVWMVARALGDDPPTRLGCSSQGCSLGVRF